MLKIRNTDQIIIVNVAKRYDVGDGPYVVAPVGPPPTPPVISNGILQEGSLTDFIMMENGTDYILQEA